MRLSCQKAAILETRELAEMGHKWGTWGSKAHPCAQWDRNWFAPAIPEQGHGAARLEVAGCAPYPARTVMLLSLAICQQGAVSLHLCSTDHGLPSSSWAKESLATAHSVKKLATSQKHESSCARKGCGSAEFAGALGIFHSSPIFLPSRHVGRLGQPKLTGASGGSWEGAHSW